MNIVEADIKDKELDKKTDINKAKKNNDECIELKNIKYQTMLINNNNQNIKKSSIFIKKSLNFIKF